MDRKLIFAEKEVISRQRYFKVSLTGCSTHVTLFSLYMYTKVSKYIHVVHRPLERQNSGFYGFFGDFGLRDTLQARIAPKPIEIDIDKLRTKFLALNVDFNGSSLDFLGSRKPAHEGIKQR